MILNGNLLIEVLPLRELYQDYRSHRRLKVFVHKGRKCVSCDRVGELMLITLGKDGSKHVDLYTNDFVLMTVDHIVPRSRAFYLKWTQQKREGLDNKQPMCSPCNGAKGHSTITNEELKVKRSGKSQRRTGVEIIRQMVYNENIFNKSLEGVI